MLVGRLGMRPGGRLVKPPGDAAPERIPPQYSPDGTWFWTGTGWIPASSVLGHTLQPPPQFAPSPTPAAPRPRPRSRRWQAVAGVIGVAALVVAATVAPRPARSGG